MTPFVKNVLTLCNKEWNFFGQQTIDIHGKMTKRGMQETDNGFWQQVGVYWQSIQHNITGKNTDYPWSAAFISYIMKTAGAGNHFRYSAAHSTYIRKAIKEVNIPSTKFRGLSVTAYSPKVGDLVGYAREVGISYNNLPSFFKSHCDIVVEVRKNEIDVIGGNVGNSVTKKTLKTDDLGLLIDTKNDWFVVIQNNL